MKRSSLLILLFFYFINGFTQAPGIKWIKYIKTATGTELFYDLKPTSDKGFIGVGTDSVFFYDRNSFLQKKSGTQPLLVKLDSAGNTVWSSFMYGFNSGLTSVVQSFDGGYVACGFDQDPSPPYDTSRFQIVKFSASGNFLWQKFYGGTNSDGAYSIARTSSGGYVVAGYTKSNNGDVSGNHNPGGTADVWLMKTDGNGNIIWKKCFGGIGPDSAYAVMQTPDKGFVVAGATGSSDGDVTGNNGATDAWIFKTDSLGNLQWQKNFGGTNYDAFNSLVLNTDGSYTATGFTRSATATTNGNKGKADVWVARISSTGAMIWSKGFGGTEDEIGFSIVSTQNDNYIIAGFTESNNGEISGNNGLSDGWLIKISSAGNLLWQKCVGTSLNEITFSGVYLTESDFVIGGLADPPTPPNDPVDGYIVRLGSTSYFRGNILAPFPAYGNFGLVQLTKPGAQYATVPFNFQFGMDVDTGNYTGNYNPPNAYYTVTPSTFNVNFPNYFDTVLMLFTIQAIPGRRDLTINVVPLGQARIGMPLPYKIYYTNVGTDTVASGQVLFKRDSRLNFISAIPAANSVNGDTLKWNYTNLKPFDTASILVNMQMQTPPAVNLGDTISSIALILPIAGDLTPSDDTSIIRQRVIGPFDPNDKTENFAGRITQQQVLSSAYINYLIRFQNTGNDTAYNVIVRDTLDNKLDWNSLQMIAASHPYRLLINSQNRLAWNFNNIKLVDSVHNEPASHGFIAYRIKTKNNLITGDTIKNTASIYFDYNLPVATNRQNTVVVNNVITGIGNPRADVSSMLLFPNPTGEIIWLKINDRVHGEAVLSVIDLNGRVIIRKNFGNINLSSFTTSIDLSGYPSGFYTITLNAGNKLYTQKLILQ